MYPATSAEGAPTEPPAGSRATSRLESTRLISSTKAFSVHGSGWLSHSISRIDSMSNSAGEETVISKSNFYPQNVGEILPLRQRRRFHRAGKYFAGKRYVTLP